MKAKAIWAAVFFLAMGSTSVAAPEEWKVADGGNGHFYEAFIVPGGIDWNDANSAAEAAGGYLATITSAQENAFVFDLIDDDPVFWDDSNPNHSHGSGPWIGGFQPAGSPEPSGNWTWVTGEPWSYDAWAPGQPNDDFNSGALQNRAHFLGYGQLIGPTWNDMQDYNLVPGYVVELVPEPATLFVMLAAGLPALLKRRRS